jgi:hypothetical protein
MYPKQVKRSLPDALHAAVPESREVQPTAPLFAAQDKLSAADDSQNAQPVALELLARLAKRDDVEDMQEFLDSFEQVEMRGLERSGAAWKADLFTQAVLVSGGRAPSGVFSLLDKYGRFIRGLCKTAGDETGAATIAAVGGCYAHEEGTMATYLSALMDRDITDAEALAAWVSARAVAEVSGQGEAMTVQEPVLPPASFTQLVRILRLTATRVRDASAELRALFGDAAMEEEETGRRAPMSDLSGAQTELSVGRAPPQKAAEAVQVIGGGDGDDGEREGRGDDDDNDAAAAAAATEEEEDVPAVDEEVVEAASARVEKAVAEAPRVFAAALQPVVDAMVARYAALDFSEKDADSTAHLDPFNVAGTSLLKLALREYAALATEVESETALGDVAAVAKAAKQGRTALPSPLVSVMRPYVPAATKF